MSALWALWFASGSDTATLLMGRVKTATDAKDMDLALKLLNAVIDIKPDFLEAWNRRATLHFMKKDYGAAIADIQQVLSREPRHFGALSGLGIILQEIGDDSGRLGVRLTAARLLAQPPRPLGDRELRERLASVELVALALADRRGAARAEDELEVVAARPVRGDDRELASPHRGHLRRWRAPATTARFRTGAAGRRPVLTGVASSEE